MDNPEKLATWGTQDTGRRQTKQNKTKNTKNQRKLKKMSNTRLNKKPGGNPKDKQFMSLMLLL